MAISSNPTKTKGIESAFRRENKRRFAKFNRYMKEEVKKTQSDLLVNAAEPFSISNDDLNRLMINLNRQANKDILGITGDPLEPATNEEWQRRYIELSYLRGVQTSEQQLSSMGLQNTAADIQAMFSLSQDEDIARAVIQREEMHGVTVTALQARAYSSLVGHTQKMIQQIRGKIAAENNQTPTGNLITQLVERVSVANSGGELVASTETIQSFQNALANSAHIRQEETGQEIKLRWLTRRDSKVRHLHAGWHGKVMTQEEYRANINKSPWNCRCGAAQVPPQANTEKRQDMFDKERAQLLEEENNNGG